MEINGVTKRSERRPVSLVADHDLARGQRLSAAMLAKGKSFNCQLCHDLGVTESTLSRWRSGKIMSVSKAVELCEQLDITLDWLVFGRSESRGERVASAGQGWLDLYALLSTEEQHLVLRLVSALESTQSDQVSLSDLAAMSPHVLPDLLRLSNRENKTSSNEAAAAHDACP